MPVGTGVDLGTGGIVLYGDPAPPRKKVQHPPPTLFGPLLWHGRPSQQLTSSFSLRDKPTVVSAYVVDVCRTVATRYNVGLI